MGIVSVSSCPIPGTWGIIMLSWNPSSHSPFSVPLPFPASIEFEAAGAKKARDFVFYGPWIATGGPESGRAVGHIVHDPLSVFAYVIELR